MTDADMMTLNDIAVARLDHLESVKTYDENNGRFYATFLQFADDFLTDDGEKDILKWEIVHYENDGSYYMELLSHKLADGKITLHRIQAVQDTDIPDIISFLKPHYKKFKVIWSPLSSRLEK